MAQNNAAGVKRLLIDGQWVTNNDVFESVNPATGAINYQVSTADASQVNLAVESADLAVRKKEWRQMLPHVRAQILTSMANLINQREDEFARAQMLENGKVWAECKAQAKSAAATFRYYAALCETMGSEVTPSRGNYISMTRYQPYGVVAAITPWNSPLTMEAQKLAPALAAGNAVVLKPSEVTPSVGLLMGEIGLQAGLPHGILNVLTGDGATTGRHLIEHAKVRMISFTGGTSTGRAIGVSAAQRLIPAALELGGKSPHIIFADANIEAAVNGVVDGIFEGSGQSCIAGSRLFVQRSVLDKVLKLLVTKAENIKIGLPEVPGSQMGPVASFKHRQHIERYIQAARDEGGEILIGGFRPQADELQSGAFISPTVIAGLDNSATPVQEEIFGPVVCVLPFDNEEDLVEQANDTVFGLASGIWTANYQRAWRIADALDAGLVWINTYKQLSIATPFGGFKESGIGREKGVSGLRLYQQSKGIYWSMDPNNFV